MLLRRGCSSMVERKLPKLQVGVRFPSPALIEPRCQQVAARLSLWCEAVTEIFDLLDSDEVASRRVAGSGCQMMKDEQLRAVAERSSRSCRTSWTI